jgi:primary-amine oxidase
LLHRYFNLGTHHIPNTADLPNTVTTTAMSSIAIAPQNYFYGDISRRTTNGVRLSVDANSIITERNVFGTQPPVCMYDMSMAAPNLDTFLGELMIPKFPWNPSGSLQTSPGG